MYPLGLMASKLPNFPEKQGYLFHADELFQDGIADLADQEILLSDLVKRINSEVEFSQRTSVYSYIYMLDFVERVKIPDTTQVICRMKGEQRTATFPGLNRIRTESTRENVQRAIKFLNIDSVDIGLFLLSKELEATLRKYIDISIKEV